ncbi:MAG: sigma-54-dependent Fis family transcriptional regulator, partial [Spirochaetia bacterium]|nr:sigma-54-dependent Fis family transcriptional regulator [Spirochaetia bacterium]
LMETARRVSHTDTTVLVLGESGVGKSRLARFMHNNSPRRQGPFITVSCGSIPETLLESELFGVEKGAYTGAVKTREGRFQAANGGTIFLDEIGELPPPLQVKLLRVIQERKIEPLGSGKEMEVDVRVIAATNRNLDEEVASGRFREDLYFRLNVVPLVMLPLRERREDIIPLAQYFLSLYAEKDGTRYGITRPEILTVLQSYSWPGNIRELENCMERMAVLSKNGELKVADLPPRILEEADVRTNPSVASPAPGRDSLALPDEGHPPDLDHFPSMRDIEDRYIRLALQTSRGSIIKAADLLKIHRNTLSRKIEEMGIDPTAYKDRRRSRRARENVNESRQTADV